MTDEPRYYGDDHYRALVAALMRIAPVAPSLSIEPCAVTGRITDNEVKIALGERLNVWRKRSCRMSSTRCRWPLQFRAAVLRTSYSHKTQCSKKPK
jgi:hypothetical protein